MELDRNEIQMLHAALDLYEAQVKAMSQLFHRQRIDEMTIAYETELREIEALREKL
jgi:hypothetical protein